MTKCAPLCYGFYFCPSWSPFLSVAVNGENTSTVAKKIPSKLHDRTVICNVVQDSSSKEAIKSLEATLVATLEKKFDQLTAALNKTAFHSIKLDSNSSFTFSCHSNSVYSVLLLFLGQVRRLPLVRKFTRNTSELYYIFNKLNPKGYSQKNLVGCAAGFPKPLPN